VEFFARGHIDASAPHHPKTSFLPYKDQYTQGDGGLFVMSANAEDYAGDVSPAYAYDVLKAEENAVLIDVRTRPEWGFVGVPDLSDIGKLVGFIEWVSYPEMAPNDLFPVELTRFCGDDKTRAVFFLCRSGQRSRAAAIAATAAGFDRAYNIEGGFEGSLDATRHRGGVNGWKAAGLPWAQT